MRHYVVGRLCRDGLVYETAGDHAADMSLDEWGHAGWQLVAIYKLGGEIMAILELDEQPVAEVLSIGLRHLAERPFPYRR